MKCYVYIFKKSYFLPILRVRGIKDGTEKELSPNLRRTVGAISFYIFHNKSVERINRSFRG